MRAAGDPRLQPLAKRAEGAGAQPYASPPHDEWLTEVRAREQHGILAAHRVTRQRPAA